MTAAHITIDGDDALVGYRLEIDGHWYRYSDGDHRGTLVTVPATIDALNTVAVLANTGHDPNQGTLLGGDAA